MALGTLPNVGPAADYPLTSQSHQMKPLRSRLGKHKASRMVEGPLDKVVILLLHRRTPLRPGTLCAGPLGDVVRLPPTPSPYASLPRLPRQHPLRPRPSVRSPVSAPLLRVGSWRNACVLVKTVLPASGSIQRLGLRLAGRTRPVRGGQPPCSPWHGRIHILRFRTSRLSWLGEFS